MQHIGIVGCSAEGASLCYRTICIKGAEILGPHTHPQISLHTHSLSDYIVCLVAGDMEGLGRIMLDSARQLARSGADFIICPDNTIHQAFERIQPESPLPWLHIADPVVHEAQMHRYQKIGLLGTRWLVDSSVYPDKFVAAGMSYARPSVEDRDGVSRIIMDELVYGIFKPESIFFLQGVIKRLQEQGCDAVLLGCTELPLVLNNDVSALPTLDSTRLLATAAVWRSVKSDPITHAAA